MLWAQSHARQAPTFRLADCCSFASQDRPVTLLLERAVSVAVLTRDGLAGPALLPTRMTASMKLQLPASWLRLSSLTLAQQQPGPTRIRS